MAGFTPVIGALGSLGGSLGTVASTLGTVAGVAKTIQTISGADQESASLRQMRQQQELQQRQMEEANALERERNAIQDAEDEKRRQKALRNAVARQRASFGASGISNNGGGSAQAVLLGLYENSDEDQQTTDALNAVRDKSLALSQTQQTQRNLLSLTQAAENQKRNTIIEEL